MNLSLTQSLQLRLSAPLVSASHTPLDRQRLSWENCLGLQTAAAGKMLSELSWKLLCAPSPKVGHEGRDASARLTWKKAFMLFCSAYRTGGKKGQGGRLNLRQAVSLLKARIPTKGTANNVPQRLTWLQLLPFYRKAIRGKPGKELSLRLSLAQALRLHGPSILCLEKLSFLLKRYEQERKEAKQEQEERVDVEALPPAEALFVGLQEVGSKVKQGLPLLPLQKGFEEDESSSESLYEEKRVETTIFPEELGHGVDPFEEKLEEEIPSSQAKGKDKEVSRENESLVLEGEEDDYEEYELVPVARNTFRVRKVKPSPPQASSN